LLVVSVFLAPPATLLFPYTTLFRSALMHWGSAYLDENPRYDYYYNQDRYDFAMSNAMIDKLVDLNDPRLPIYADPARADGQYRRSEEHTSELQSRENLVCRLLLEKK